MRKIDKPSQQPKQPLIKPKLHHNPSLPYKNMIPGQIVWHDFPQPFSNPCLDKNLPFL